MKNEIIRGTQDAPDEATAYLLTVISRDEDAIVALIKLQNPTVDEEKLRELLRNEGEGENLDYLLQEQVRAGLKGSLDKQAKIDARKNER